MLNTGRTIYQFHTRTKTARAPELEAAAPDVWVELAQTDARAARDRRGRYLRHRFAPRRGACPCSRERGSGKESSSFLSTMARGTGAAMRRVPRTN